MKRTHTLLFIGLFTNAMVISSTKESISPSTCTIDNDARESTYKSKLPEKEHPTLFFAYTVAHTTLLVGCFCVTAYAIQEMVSALLDVHLSV